MRLASLKFEREFPIVHVFRAQHSVDVGVRMIRVSRSESVFTLIVVREAYAKRDVALALVTFFFGEYTCA